MIFDEMVRQRILREHAILRVLIERLQRAAQAAATEDGFAQELRDAGRTLHLVLEAHALLEEQSLGPAIVASRGPRLLEEMHEHHARALAELQRLRGRGSENYATTALRFVPHLLTALDLEDRELCGTSADAPARTPQRAREFAGR
jgi:hemerythrin-like domain-containing protein